MVVRAMFNGTYLYNPWRDMAPACLHCFSPGEVVVWQETGWRCTYCNGMFFETIKLRSN